MDMEAAYLTQQTLGRVLKVCTSLVIAHRLSTIHNADKIIVLERRADSGGRGLPGAADLGWAVLPALPVAV